MAKIDKSEARKGQLDKFGIIIASGNKDVLEQLRSDIKCDSPIRFTDDWKVLEECAAKNLPVCTIVAHDESNPLLKADGKPALIRDWYSLPYETGFVIDINSTFGWCQASRRESWQQEVKEKVAGADAINKLIHDLWDEKIIAKWQYCDPGDDITGYETRDNGYDLFRDGERVGQVVLENSCDLGKDSFALSKLENHRYDNFRMRGIIDNVSFRNTPFANEARANVAVFDIMERAVRSSFLKHDAEMVEKVLDKNGVVCVEALDSYDSVCREDVLNGKYKRIDYRDDFADVPTVVTQDDASVDDESDFEQSSKIKQAQLGE